MAIFRKRLCFQQLEGPPQEGEEGIIAVGVQLTEKDIPLLLLWDEGMRNPGHAITDVMEPLLSWLSEEWPDLDVRSALVVEQDSLGYFDQAQVSWASPGSGLPPVVTWSPVRWPNQVPRSEEAFRHCLGLQAQEALHQVYAIMGGLDEDAASGYLA